ncbi:MAG: M20/M25/M40 family metallo-hydrolase [Verrucomicrobia bacterium]|nr:M20/M25/M40 family metallo-hydrolase [Verrucomicrobiota bacterium]
MFPTLSNAGEVSHQTIGENVNASATRLPIDFKLTFRRGDGDGGWPEWRFDHALAHALASHAGRERRCRPVFGCSSGFNDMHFFARHLKIPTLGYGPGGEACHAVDERAPVRELLASARIYAALMTQPL